MPSAAAGGKQGFSSWEMTSVLKGHVIHWVVFFFLKSQRSAKTKGSQAGKILVLV